MAEVTVCLITSCALSMALSVVDWQIVPIYPNSNMDFIFHIIVIIELNAQPAISISLKALVHVATVRPMVRAIGPMAFVSNFHCLLAIHKSITTFDFSSSTLFCLFGLLSN